MFQIFVISGRKNAKGHGEHAHRWHWKYIQHVRQKLFIVYTYITSVFTMLCFKQEKHGPIYIQ